VAYERDLIVARVCVYLIKARRREEGSVLGLKGDGAKD
jgi:hypothetical protein